jgi:hypothetical protein
MKVLNSVEDFLVCDSNHDRGHPEDKIDGLLGQILQQPDREEEKLFWSQMQGCRAGKAKVEVESRVIED